MRPTAYRRNARGLRDREAFERIRLQAGELFDAGRSQAEVARELGVARQNVSRWHARWRQGGREGLAGPGRWGRPSRLSEADWRRVEHALLAGAEAHGFMVDALARPLSEAPDALDGALRQVDRAVSETAEHHAHVRLRRLM